MNHTQIEVDGEQCHVFHLSNWDIGDWGKVWPCSGLRGYANHPIAISATTGDFVSIPDMVDSDECEALRSNLLCSIGITRIGDVSYSPGFEFERGI